MEQTAVGGQQLERQWCVVRRAENGIKRWKHLRNEGRKNAEKSRIVRKMFNNIPEGTQDISMSKDRWVDNVVYGLKKMIVRRWRKTSRDKDACNLILMELKVLTGQ
jgi:hypothetical protein